MRRRSGVRLCEQSVASVTQLGTAADEAGTGEAAEHPPRHWLAARPQDQRAPCRLVASNRAPVRVLPRRITGARSMRWRLRL